MTPSSLSLWAWIRCHPDPQAASSARGVFNDIILEESAGIVGRLARLITPCHGSMVAVDIDVSPFDNSKTKKEGVSRTYKKFDGYAPIFAYVREEGYLANLELRPGSDHSQKGTESFLRQTLRYACLQQAGARQVQPPSIAVTRSSLALPWQSHNPRGWHSF